MPIDYNAIALGTNKNQGVDTTDYNKIYTGVASPKTFTPKTPTPQTPATPAPEKPKNIFQKTGDIVKDFGVGLATPFVKGYELISQGAKAYGAVAKGGVQLLKGDKAGAQATLNTEAQRLTAERAKPIDFAGTQVNRVSNMKEAAGTALEILSYGVGAGEGLAAKNIIKQTLAEGLKVGALQVGKRMAVGALGMGAYGAGAAMQENKGAKDIAINAVKNAGIGAIFEVGLLGLGAGGALMARKYERVMNGLKPLSDLERQAADEGEKMLPKSIKVGEVVTNQADNKITYQKQVNLGKTDKGEPMLYRLEINSKTGEAKVILDKSLDNTPGRKGQILEDAHKEIIAHRLKVKQEAERSAAGEKILNDINAPEVKSLPAPDKSKSYGEGFVMKDAVDTAAAKKSKLSQAYQKLLDQYNKKPTAELLTRVRAAKAKLEAEAPKIKTAGTKAVEDLQKRLGKTADEMTDAVKKEVAQFGGDMIQARKAFVENPVAVKESAPTIAAILEHQTDTNVTIITKSIKDLLDEKIAMVEEKAAKLKEKPVEPIMPKEPAETYTPKAAQRLEQEAIAKKLTEGFDDLPVVEKKHLVDERVLHLETEKDKNILDQILSGELKKAPNGELAGSVWRFEAEKARLSGDVARQRELAKSPLAAQFSEEGASHAMLRGMDWYDPTRVMQRVNKLRTTIKSKIKESQAVNELKAAIKKVAPSKQSWSDFISEITCK